MACPHWQQIVAENGNKLLPVASVYRPLKARKLVAVVLIDKLFMAFLLYVYCVLYISYFGQIK